MIKTRIVLSYRKPWTEARDLEGSWGPVELGELRVGHRMGFRVCFRPCTCVTPTPDLGGRKEPWVCRVSTNPRSRVSPPVSLGPEKRTWGPGVASSEPAQADRKEASPAWAGQSGPDLSLVFNTIMEFRSLWHFKCCRD